MAPKRQTSKRRLRRGANLLTSVVLVLPLLVFYEVGVLFTARMNGADLITQWLLSIAGKDGFLLIQLGLVLAMVGLALYLKQKQQFDVQLFVPVLLESAIYALTMGTLIIFVMVDLLGIEPSLAAGGALARASVFERLVMAVGAGVHEELVFRLILMGGLLLLLERTFELRPWAAVTIAVVVSSLLFSAAHHIGPFGEPLRLAPLVYRSLAGVFFALLFRYRSFAIAVYTHALYDVYVMLLAP
jgi:hypothetical protein